MKVLKVRKLRIECSDLHLNVQLYELKSDPFFIEILIIASFLVYW